MNDPPRPDWQGAPMPLRNFRFKGDLTEADSAWFRDFGRKLDEARKDWARKER